MLTTQLTDPSSLCLQVYRGTAEKSLCSSAVELELRKNSWAPGRGSDGSLTGDRSHRKQEVQNLCACYLDAGRDH